jgi:hypothetical protein
MTDRDRRDDHWDATWEAVRKDRPRLTLSATPAQRLAWLEEMLEIAYRVGALGRDARGPKG